MTKKLKLAALVVASACATGAAVSQAASVDAGKTAFASNCASCHSPSERRAWSNTSSAIRKNTGGMGYLSYLSATEVLDITTYLANPTTTDADRLFNWAEANYPSLLAPRATSQSLAGYLVRYYSQTNTYVGTANGQLYFFDANHPAAGIVPLGSVSSWLNTAGL
ncbi:MAG: hypothetical protein KGZ83_17840 [Sulfuricella sp.]|nr:hypothetical protein [Sulfuricella sp.]